MNILEIAYCKYDTYPNIKLNDVIKIPINMLAKEEIKVVIGKIEQTKFEKVADYTYIISFGDFELENLVGDSNYPAFMSSINIIKIPYCNNQYFLMHLYDYESDFLKNYGSIKNKTDFIYSCKFELEVEPGPFSKVYNFSYLKDSGEPEDDSLTHYLLKNYFIDWKVKSIKDTYIEKYFENTQSSHRFIVELEYQNFIDTYDNVIYET